MALDGIIGVIKNCVMIQMKLESYDYVRVCKFKKLKHS